MNIRLVVNGEEFHVETEARITLLETLRNVLGIKSVHKGCLEGECGACTVLMDGEPVYSCLTLAAQAEGSEITTVEGLMQGEKLHPLMESFVKNHGLQCGYCTSGLILTAYSFLNRTTEVTEESIRKSIEGNICRCTGYINIVKSIQAANKEKASGKW
jgi:carbon-monoxide dehydrogenase small subunit